MIYPWQTSTWERVVQAVLQAGAMPPALLFHGPTGIGKTQLAVALAHALLCEDSAAQAVDRASDGRKFLACGRCTACRWLYQLNHPDFLLVRPSAAEAIAPPLSVDSTLNHSSSKAGGQEITLKQIRELILSLQLGLHRGKYKIALLYPAETLNTYAANAILKILEEPPRNTIFMLVTSQVEQILPTIRSRCQAIPLPMPSAELALSWLRAEKVAHPDDSLHHMGGAPLAAFALSKDADKLAAHQALLDGLAKGKHIAWLELAERLHKDHLSASLLDVQRWVYDLFSLSLTQQVRYFPRYKKLFSSILHSLPVRRLEQLLTKLQRRQYHCSHPLNPKLMLENTFIDYSRLFVEPETQAVVRNQTGISL
jgi:DNA polymerase III subunit delta'